MKTRLQIAQTVQGNLNDAAGIFFEISPNINDSIQDGYDEILCETQCYEATTSLTFTNGLLYYNLYELLPSPGFWRLTKAFNQNTNRWLKVMDTRFFDKYRFDWEASNGTPWFLQIVNFQYITFFPHYVTGAGLKFDLFYRVGKDILTKDDQLVQIPDPHTRVIENYCTADLLEQYREFGKAANYRADYLTGLQELRNHVANRMQYDLYQQLNDLDFPQAILP